MQKILATLAVTALLTPAFAAADSTYGIEPTLGQLLSRIAALQAILGGKSINCAVAATKSTVQTGESFTIAWGSYDADASYSNDPQNMYPQNGQQLMRIDVPEIRTYQFAFFGPNGTKATCYQTITVLPQA